MYSQHLQSSKKDLLRKKLTAENLYAKILNGSKAVQSATFLKVLLTNHFSLYIPILQDQLFLTQCFEVTIINKPVNRSAVKQIFSLEKITWLYNVAAVRGYIMSKFFSKFYYSCWQSSALSEIAQINSGLM